MGKITKSKEKSSAELKRLRSRVKKLEASEKKHQITEEALAKSESRFREMAEFLPESVFEMTLEGNITFANNYGLLSFGYTREDMARGMNAFKMMAPEAMETAAANLKKVLSGETLGNNEYIAQKKDGTRFPVIIQTTPIIHNGEICGIRGIIVNISKIKEAEEVIKKVNENLEKNVGERTLELKTANEKLVGMLEGIVTSLSNAVEKRDPYTAGHQQSVAKLAKAIAEKLKLPADKIKGITIAALLHDIGKIYVPAEILSKPAKLTFVEKEMIKTHSNAGFEILNTINFPWPIAQAILEHHERLNGSGYPNGLKDKEIMLEAKILAVADVVEAMASHRPYRPSLGLEKALEEISQNKGTLYDPEVVDACLALFKDGEFTLPK